MAPSPPPAKLAFTAQPGDATAGNRLSPLVVVALQDASGHTVTTANDPVTVTMGPNTRGATLSGTTTVTSVNGIATFSDLSVRRAGTGYLLTASSENLPSAVSAPFAITPGTAAMLGFVFFPGSADAATPIAPAVQVAIQDSFANTVPKATDPVALALGANPDGATLAGTLTVPAVNRVATFADVTIDRPGIGGYLRCTRRSDPGSAHRVGLGGVRRRKRRRQPHVRFDPRRRPLLLGAQRPRPDRGRDDDDSDQSGRGRGRTDLPKPERWRSSQLRRHPTYGGHDRRPLGDLLLGFQLLRPIGRRSYG